MIPRERGRLGNSKRGPREPASPLEALDRMAGGGGPPELAARDRPTPPPPSSETDTSVADPLPPAPPRHSRPGAVSAQAAGTGGTGGPEAGAPAAAPWPRRDDLSERRRGWSAARRAVYCTPPEGLRVYWRAHRDRRNSGAHSGREPWRRRQQSDSDPASPPKPSLMEGREGLARRRRSRHTTGVPSLIEGREDGPGLRRARRRGLRVSGRAHNDCRNSAE